MALLSAANLEVRTAEEHNSVLTEFVNQMRTRLLAAEVLMRLQKLALPGFDFETAKNIARHALQSVREGKLGYAIIAAARAGEET